MILKELKVTDKVFISIDRDKSVKNLKKIHNDFGHEYILHLLMVEIRLTLVLEKKICNELGIKLIDGLGDKIQSSSWILNNKS